MKIIFSSVFLSAVLMTSFAQSQVIKKILDENKSIRQDISIPINGNETQLPVTVIKGEKPGPVFSIVAGIHGFEYPPIIAVQQLMKEIDPKSLKGTLIFIPIANLPSFYKRTPFVNPLDNKNLNNAFPGSETGTSTDQIAYKMTTEIISNSDIFLDIHGGDANEDLLSFVCYYNREDLADKTNLAHQLSEKSGIATVVSYPFNINLTEPAKYAFKQATQQGITALSIEAGKLGNVQDNNVKLIKNAVYNMLRHLGMYNSKTSGVLAKPKFFDRQDYIKVPQSGIFYSQLKSGDQIRKDQILGYITDEFGNKKQDIISESDGVILYKIGTPPVNKGETLFCIGSQKSN